MSEPKLCNRCGQPVSTYGVNDICEKCAAVPYKQARAADGSYYIEDRRSGKVVLEGESYQVAANVLSMLNSGRSDESECGEVADAILARRREVAS